MKKATQPKPIELPKCAYCREDVHVRVDGGKVKIPISVTHGQFEEYNGFTFVHNKCLNPLIARIISKRKPLVSI